MGAVGPDPDRRGPRLSQQPAQPKPQRGRTPRITRRVPKRRALRPRRRGTQRPAYRPAAATARGAEILQDISVALEPGGFYFLTGASGAGKSTLLKIICLAEPPTHGMLRLFDTDTGKLDRTGRAALRRRIGIVFQDFRLIDDLSVAENVALPLRIAGPAQQEIREHVAALLGWLGLEEHIDATTSDLSRSERQRVAIARAIVSRPDLLVADEPTGHVDDEIALL